MFSFSLPQTRLYYKGLVCIKDKLVSDPSIPIEQYFRPQFRRSIFTVGLIMRYFDFQQPEVYGAPKPGEDSSNQGNLPRPSCFPLLVLLILLVYVCIAGSTLPANICEDVFATLAFFLSCDHSEICKEALTSMGNFCVKNYEYLMKVELRDYYNYLLTQDKVLTDMKITVLKNILMYLTEEENQMVRKDKECKWRGANSDLREVLSNPVTFSFHTQGRNNRKRKI